MRHPIAFVFNVVAFAMARLCRYRSSYFLDALHSCLIHAHHRILRVLRPMANLQHRLHLTYKCSTLLCRNAPHTFLPRFYSVFFNTCRTVSGEIDSTISNSTIRSLSICKVQRQCPSGGVLHTKLTKRASPFPSSTRERSRKRTRRSSAACKPSQIHRSRICSTVRRVQPIPSATSRSGRLFPCSPSPTSNRARA